MQQIKSQNQLQIAR